MPRYLSSTVLTRYVSSALVVAALCHPGAASAETPGASADSPAPPPPAPATLRLLVKSAVASNPRVRALESRIRAAEERERPAGALPDPMLDARFEGIPRGNLNPARGEEKRVMLSQTFPGRGKRGAAQALAHAETDALRWELAAARNELGAEVAAGVNGVHGVQARLAVLDESAATLRLLASLTRTRYQVGTSAQDDYLRATIELSEVTAMTAAERAKFHAAVARVNLAADRAADADLEFPDWRPAPPVTLDLDALKALALEISPAMHASDAGITRGEGALALARRAGRPDIMLGLGWMMRRDREDEWMGEVALNLPVRRGSRVAAPRHEAEASLAAARADREVTRNAVLLDVENTWARLQAANINLDRYREVTLPQSDLAVSSNRYSYEHGRGDFARLIDAVRVRIRYRLEEQEAIIERDNAVAELARAVGDMSLLLGDLHD